MRVRTLGRGVLLPELKLALDTSAPGFESVVSHGHGDHVPWGLNVPPGTSGSSAQAPAEATRAWASPETADILSVRAPLIRVTAIPWREPTRVGAARVTLLPAGHILGSALTLVEAPDGATLLYTGDTKARASLTCDAPEFPQADELIVESTFGLPIYRFPALDALQERAAAFARAAFAEGAVPVFLGYALGKAQEILAMLTRAGVPTVAHGAVWNMCAVYERHGRAFPTTRPYEAGKVEGAAAEPASSDRPRRIDDSSRAALVVPDSFREHPMVAKLDARLAYCSGWAVLSKSRVQMDADLLLPLSDHADYPGLLSIVDQVRPKRVYANHGYADVFAHLLRKRRGLDAQPLSVGHIDEDALPPGQTRLEGEA